MSIQIRKRVPKALVSVLNSKEIKRTFTSQYEVDAFDTLLAECVVIVSFALPLEITTPIVLDKGLEQYRNQLKTSPTRTQSIEEVTALYLAHSKGNVSTIEYKNRVDFFTKLLPALFTYLNLPNLSEMTASHMLTLSNAILKLPNRKYYEYRTLPIEEFVALKVPADQRQKIDSCNKQIKRIRSLALYGESSGLYKMPTKITTHKEKFNKVEGYVSEQEAISNLLPFTYSFDK